MALHDITRAAFLSAVDEFDRLGRVRFLERYKFGSARSYLLRQGGRDYDSKAIVGAAHAFARPDLGPLAAADFSGRGATVGQLLEQLGFEIAEPSTTLANRNPGLDARRADLGPRSLRAKPGLGSRAELRCNPGLNAKITAVARCSA